MNCILQNINLQSKAEKPFHTHCIGTCRKKEVSLKNGETDGVITVYLSLILLIILSLLFTVIESARVYTARVYVERSLTTAMDSVMAEYYEPLWKEYHIFGLDASYGSDSVQASEIKAKLEDYMSYPLYQNSPGEQRKDQKGTDLLTTSIDSVSLTDLTFLTDCQGELFLNEAVKYMKYREAGNAFELLLDKLSLLKSPGKLCTIYEEKLKAEEQLVEIDKGILELMELLDGMKTSKKGLKVSKDGKLKTVPYFIKKICIGELTKESAGINNDTIFLALKGNYVMPENDFQAIDNSFLRLEEVLLRVGEKETAIASVEENLSQLYQARAQLPDEENSSEEEMDKRKELEAQILSTDVVRDALVRERNELISQKEFHTNGILSEKKEIDMLIQHLIPLIEKGQKAIDQIIIKTELAAPFLDAYETVLDREKEGLDETIWEGLKDDLQNLKRYTAKDGCGYDFAEMKRILGQDKRILWQTANLLDQAQQEFSLEEMAASKRSFQSAWDILSGYTIKGLTLDYSTLTIQQSKEKDLLEAMQSTVLGGITGLVMDRDTISEAELSERAKPSDLAAVGEEQGGFGDEFMEFIKRAVIGDQAFDLGGIFGSLADQIGETAWIEEGINDIAMTLLFQEYMKNHFYAFPKEGENLNARKPSALLYEQEYLLAGKQADESNLSSVIARILAIRMAADLVTILTDKRICEEAKAAAAAMVGFTGLPILISITQVLILILWTFAEALADTCALLKGREVPIIKKEAVMKLNDLLLLTRDNIEKKALTISDTGGMTFSYHGYLSILLLFANQTHLIYRSMDLIEENLNLRYKDSFCFQNCLYGFEAEAQYIIRSKFTSFPFVQKYSGKHALGFQYKAKAAYSY